MIKKKILFVLSFLTILSMFGCYFFRSDVNKYIVKVRFNSGEKLENVSAVVGADKFWWTSFDAGEEKTVNLFSDKNAVNNLTLLYTLGGRQRTWESANFAENADYQINVTIDSAGNVAENSCQLPCR